MPLIAAGATMLAASAHADTPAMMAAADVFELRIEELGELRVTSVSRRSERAVARGAERDSRHSGRVTLQGDVYDAELGAMLRPDFTVGTLPGPEQPGHVDIGGFNVLARWDEDLGDGGHLQLQTYFDRCRTARART